jgi:hypothetical protein
MAWTDPRSWTPGLTVTAAILNTEIRDNLSWLYDNLPIRASMFHGDALVTNGNAIATNINANQPFNATWQQSTSADGDEFTNSFILGEGTYTMYLLGQLTLSSGLIDWDIDGTTITTGQDWYGALSSNAEKSIASVVIAANESGRHVLTGTVNGQNASSGGYDIRLTKIWFEPAADS